MPADLKTRAPARSRAEEPSGGASCHPRVARDELGAKMMGHGPAKLSDPDPRLLLRKRLREEMEALHGILKKAELLAGKTADNGRAAPAPRRGKDGRLSAAEARPVATEAESKPCAKRRKTMPVVEIVEPRMSKDEVSILVTRLSSLAEDMPPHILEFLRKKCAGQEDRSCGEIEIDIGSMKPSVMFDLRKLLDKYAEEEKRRQQIEESKNASTLTSRSPPPQHEDGEIVEDKDNGTITDRCGDSSPVAAGKVPRSSPRLLEDGEIEEEVDAVCAAAAAPVATEGFAETRNSPGSSSSSSTSFSGSSSSSGCSSGGSCGHSSGSDSSDSDSDDESVTSSPAPAVLPKNEASPVAAVLCSSPRLREQGGASLVAPEKLAETVNCPRSSSRSGSVRNSPAPVVQKQAAQDHKLPLSQTEYRDTIAKGRQIQRRLQDPERQRAYEELEQMERNAKPISDGILPMDLRQLGIITPVEYAVTPERRVRGRGSPVQKLLGLFLKAE